MSRAGCEVITHLLVDQRALLRGCHVLSAIARVPSEDAVERQPDLADLSPTQHDKTDRLHACTGFVDGSVHIQLYGLV
jgi:hypothetical protein